MSNKSISILGCGWLGLPLGREFAKAGWCVRGSTTSLNKKELLRNGGIEPFLLKLGKASEFLELKDFLNSKYLIVNVTPSRDLAQPESYHHLAEGIKTSPIENVILVSSTSVYENVNGLVKEEATNNLPDIGSGMLAIERYFQKIRNIKVTVLRLAGLIGPNRHPGNFFRNGRVVNGSNLPVNLIHLDDCTGIIRTIINKDIWGEVFNGCADTHPNKRDFYSKAALKVNRIAPVFNTIDTSISGKIISNEKVKNLLDYTFIHPDLMLLLDKDYF